MYQVLARKWRPQSFDQVVGQQHVTRTLANAIGSDRLAHAYIFSGLRGSGKTTAARILAKCLNCEKGPTPEPCGQCAACEEIAESRAIDVLEVDAASRTKVEQTRELLEMVAYAPARDRYKILIIDEAHMLSKASFNALLKTLEEPPPNVLFVLATTEIQKILPTILSRCQIFEFRRVGPRELGEHLSKICAEEEIEVSRATLERIARAGEGSVRDALSLLERAVAFCGPRIEDEDVLRMLGAVRSEVLSGLVSALAARDAAGMLTVLDCLVDEGHDLTHFWTELVAALRDLLVMRSLPGQPDLLARSPDEAAALEAAAKGLSREDLTRAFQIVADLEPALRSSSRPRFMFEAALIRLAGLGAVKPIEEVLRALGGTATTTTPPDRAQKKNPRPAVAADRPNAETTAASGIQTELIVAVRKERPMVAAILEQAGSIELCGDDLVLGFDAGASAMLRPLDKKESLELIARHAGSLAGRSVRVRVEVGGESVRPTVERPLTRRPTAPRKTEQPPKDSISSDRETLLKRATQEPGVRKLLHDFGAQVVEIQPLEPDRTGPRGPLEEPK
jgi:DNA polymerase-3 subunit gamma/tau